SGRLPRSVAPSGNMAEHSPLTVAGAAAALRKFFSHAPRSLLIPCGNHQGNSAMAATNGQARRSRMQRRIPPPLSTHARTGAGPQVWTMYRRTVIAKNLLEPISKSPEQDDEASELNE